MTYSEEFIKELNNRNLILQVAEEYCRDKGLLLVKVGSHTYSMLCPFPDHDEKNGSFIIFELTGTYKCFGCNRRGNTLSFLRYVVYEDNYQKAVQHLCKLLNISIPCDKEYEAYTRQRSNWAKQCYHNHCDFSLNYLYERGLSNDDIATWAIGYDKTQNKIVFPLINICKEVLGLSKRYIDLPEGAMDKYRNPANDKYFNKSDFLYGIHLYDKSQEEVYFVEGYMDAILGTKYGLNNTMAVLGHEMSQSHAEWVKSGNKKPIIIYDNDEAGIKGMHSSCKLLENNGLTPYVVILPQGYDMADACLKFKEGIIDYIKENLISYSYYLIKNALIAYNQEAFDFRKKYFDLLFDSYKKVSEKEKKYISSHILSTTGIDGIDFTNL